MDDFLEPIEVPRQITIKEVLPTAEEAMRECERLNRLNEGKSRYFWQSAKHYPRGR